VQWRDFCPGNDEKQPQGQLNASDLLKALQPTTLRGRGNSKSHAGGALPADGFCVLGVTLTDLFCADDDVFTGGLASLKGRTGVFSFHRYLDPAQTAGVALHRACKTAVHEIAHMFGVGHCVHASCLMNGSGHLMEDFAAPAHLCPADLAKFVHVLGIKIRERYLALAEFCKAHPDGFAAQERWIAQALAVLDADGARAVDRATGVGPGDAGVEPQAVPEDRDVSGVAPPRPGRTDSKRGSKRERTVVGGEGAELEGDEEDEDDMIPLRERLAARAAKDNKR